MHCCVSFVRSVFVPAPMMGSSVQVGVSFARRIFRLDKTHDKLLLAFSHKYDVEFDRTESIEIET